MSSDRVGTEGKRPLSPSQPGEALRKRWGVRKTSEMLPDFSGRKSLQRDPDAESAPAARGPWEPRRDCGDLGPQSRRPG